MDKNRAIARVANEPFRIIDWLADTYPDVLDEYYQEYCLPTKEEQARALGHAVDTLVSAGLDESEALTKMRGELAKVRDDLAKEEAQGVVHAVRK